MKTNADQDVFRWKCARGTMIRLVVLDEGTIYWSFNKTFRPYNTVDSLELTHVTAHSLNTAYSLDQREVPLRSLFV